MTMIETYTAFIDTLSKLTAEKKCIWTTVASFTASQTDNQRLKHFLLSYNKYIYSTKSLPIINEYDSLCAKLDNGFIYIFAVTEGTKKYLLLGVQNGIDKMISKINNEYMLQDELDCLYEVIGIKENNMENFEFIEKIISDYDN